MQNFYNCYGLYRDLLRVFFSYHVSVSPCLSISFPLICAPLPHVPLGDPSCLSFHQSAPFPSHVWPGCFWFPVFVFKSCLWVKSLSAPSRTWVLQVCVSTPGSSRLRVFMFLCCLFPCSMFHCSLPPCSLFSGTHDSMCHVCSILLFCSCPCFLVFKSVFLSTLGFIVLVQLFSSSLFLLLISSLRINWKKAVGAYYKILMWQKHSDTKTVQFSPVVSWT